MFSDFCCCLERTKNIKVNTFYVGKGYLVDISKITGQYTIIDNRVFLHKNSSYVCRLNNYNDLNICWCLGNKVLTTNVAIFNTQDKLEELTLYVNSDIYDLEILIIKI